MQKSHTIESITDYVIKWVEDRYNDDEYVSIALQTINNCIRYKNSADDLLAYIMRSVYHACRNHIKLVHTALSSDIQSTAAILDLKDLPLTNLEKQILTYRFQHNLQFKDIAREMSLTYSQVRYSYWCSLNKLRKYYEDTLDTTNIDSRS